MTPYFLIDPGAGMPKWCSMSHDADGGVQWVDFKGRTMAGKPLAHVIAENVHATVTDVPGVIADLERGMAYRHLLDPWSDQGWLSPTGRFYGCSFFAHDDIATALLRRAAWELEEQGYVRVHADSYRIGETSRRRGPTPQQREALTAMGFDVDEPWGQQRRAAIDRTAPPPRHAVRPPGFRMPDVPPPSYTLAQMVARLREFPPLAALLANDIELVPDVGGGNWDWMVTCGDIHLGGEDLDWVMAGPGLHLHRLCSDQVEVSPWPYEGFHVQDEALLAIEAATAWACPSPTA